MPTPQPWSPPQVSGDPGTAYRNNPLVPANWNGANFRGRMEDAIDTESSATSQPNYAFARASAFDPAAAFRDYTTAAKGEFDSDLATQLKTLAGQSVGSGHLDTGFYDMDKGALVKQLAAQYNDKISQAALEATGQGVTNNKNLLDAAEQNNADYLSLLGGTYDRAQNEWYNAQAHKGGGLGSVLGSLAGAALGSFAGGVGSAAGAKLGGSLFK